MINDLQSLNSFVRFCESKQNIANEGKIVNGIKKVINNTINKKLKNKTKNPNDNQIRKDIKVSFEAKKASGSIFDHLYKTEAMCAEGLTNPCDENTHKFFASYISKWEGCPNKIYFYYCTGGDLNKYYHLTGDNQYPNDLGIFFIDWSNFNREFDASSHKGKFRWFSDVVDNNARREIRANNPYYKDYHSLYGDDWFYSTI